MSFSRLMCWRRAMSDFPIAIVDESRARDVCLVGGGERSCRWLGRGPVGYMCLKHDPSLNGIIRQRFEAGEMGAKGDNCDGLWPTLITGSPISDIATQPLGHGVFTIP